MQSPEQLDLLVQALHSPPVIFAQSAYYTITIAGGLLLVLVLVTFSTPAAGAARNAALFNFLLGLVIGMALGPALLPLSGHMQTPIPPRRLCLIQVGLMRGGIIMCGVAAIGLAVTLLGRRRPSRLLRISTSALPGASAIVYELIASLFSDGQLEIQRTVLLCEVLGGQPFFENAPMVTSNIATFIVVCASIYLVIRIRNTLRLIGFRNLGDLINEDSERGSWISLLIRVFMFAIVCVIGAVLVSVDTAGKLEKGGPAHITLLLVSGTTPLIAFLIFGTVSSLRKIWCDWACRILISDKTLVPQSPGDTNTQES
ncbi:hypothetical protein AURDEDRAFT_184551, partial [Auricularia subglabra TFB-10046 SS5]